MTADPGLQAPGVSPSFQCEWGWGTQCDGQWARGRPPSSPPNLCQPDSPVLLAQQAFRNTRVLLGTKPRENPARSSRASTSNPFTQKHRCSQSTHSVMAISGVRHGDSTAPHPCAHHSKSLPTPSPAHRPSGDVTTRVLSVAESLFLRLPLSFLRALVLSPTFHLKSYDTRLSLPDLLPQHDAL